MSAPARKVFTWSVAGYIGSIVLGAILGIVNRLLIYVLIFIAGVITLGTVWLSVKSALRFLYLLVTLAGIVLVWNLVDNAYDQAQRDRELELKEGVLVPSDMNIPTPTTQCQIPPVDLIIFLGRSSTSYTSRYPHIVVRINNMSLLSLDQPDKGKLSVSFRIFDDRGNIIARSDRNKFWVDRNARLERLSESSLSVFDHSDKEVLQVQFINRTAVKITGIFRHPNIPAKPLVITDDLIQFPGRMGQLRGACNGGPDIDLDVSI